MYFCYVLQETSNHVYLVMEVRYSYFSTELLLKQTAHHTTEYVLFLSHFATFLTKLLYCICSIVNIIAATSTVVAADMHPMHSGWMTLLYVVVAVATESF